MSRARTVCLLCLFLACGRTEPLRPSRTQPQVSECQLVLTPAELDFGTVRPGQRSVRFAELRNDGLAPCDIGSIALPTAQGFSIETPPSTPREMSPGDVLPLTLSFITEMPTPPERRDVLTVGHGSDEETLTVALVATVAACKLLVSPNPLDFGNVSLNTTLTNRITFSNVGSLTCDVSGLALEPGTDALFTFPAQPTSFSLAPGQSGTVSISFSGTDSAPPHLRTGSLGYRSNDFESNEGRVALSAFINTLCTQAGQFIYTVDGDGRFSRFDPRTLSYLDIGPLNCPTTGTPFSMNVDQNAIAWVIFSDRRLYRVDTADGSCTATSYQPDQSGFGTYGMGSTFDSSTGVDTLFLSTLRNADGRSWLGSLAFPSLTVTPLGPISEGNVELTGTGDGQLWAFAPPNGGAVPTLARVDPRNGQSLERYELRSINSLGGWAIKFFGGAFFVFIGSDVWKVERSSLDPANQPQPLSMPTRVLVSPGRDIVGAGVSTCAPIQ